MKVYYKFYCKMEPQLSTLVNVHKNKAWFKTIANESKGQISLGRSYLG